MADNFDLKKFLKENKSLEKLNPIMANSILSENSSMKAKIKEYILAELGNDYDYEEEDIYGDNDDDEAGYFSHVSDLEDAPMDDELDEAKKKDKEEDTEDIEPADVEMEDIPAEDEAPIEDTQDGVNGIEDIAADMKGTESDLMDHLMKALQIAKGMQNEKLETQVGNTLKFFVSEYIGGGEQ